MTAAHCCQNQVDVLALKSEAASELKEGTCLGWTAASWGMVIASFGREYDEMIHTDEGPPGVGWEHVGAVLSYRHALRSHSTVVAVVGLEVD